MSAISIGLEHLALCFAEDAHALSRVQSYDMYDPHLFENADLDESIITHPRFVGNPIKSNVSIGDLKMSPSAPTHRDLDAINAPHLRRRTGQRYHFVTLDDHKAHYHLAHEALYRYSQSVPELSTRTAYMANDFSGTI
ncbi:hypothetical protein [Aggregatilinea lenta]|uniref:hypothetical protein n=1 Tax=Aggregatilinea lenta TaxID=913108 RepID=UPI0013C2EB84|nr:hypothetical protein [Aggregatilinea lenta]